MGTEGSSKPSTAVSS